MKVTYSPLRESGEKLTYDKTGTSRCGGSLLSRSEYYDVKRSRLDAAVRLDYATSKRSLPFSPYQRSSSVNTYLNGNYYRWTPGDRGDQKNNIATCYGGASAITLSESDLTIKASQDYFKRLGKLDSLNLAVSLAEMSETIGTVASVATRLGLAYRHLRKGRIGSAFAVLDISPKMRLSANDIRLAGLPYKKGGWTSAMHKSHLSRMVPKGTRRLERFGASTWLEIQYGWRPILSDVYGMAQLIAEQQHRNNFDVQVSGYGFERKTGVASPSYYLLKSYCTSLTVVKYCVRLKVVNPTLRLHASLGLTNPALIAWELVPFSFVVDWFVPIGNSLQQLSAQSGYKVTDSCKTYFQKLTLDVWADFHPTVLCSQHTDAFEMRRIVGSTPGFTFPSIDLKKALSINHLITSLSLLTTAFLK